jgi:hypothetical protein
MIKNAFEVINSPNKFWADFLSPGNFSYKFVFVISELKIM